MAKISKKIDEFQKALSSNTKFIGKEEDIVFQSINSIPEKDSNIMVDKNVYFQFKILAKYLKVDQDSLIDQALRHFLKLKGSALEKALIDFTDEKK